MPWLEFLRNFKRVGRLNKTNLLSEINFKVVLKVKKATKIDKIFTVDLTVTTYCQIDDEDFVNFCGLLRKRELKKKRSKYVCIMRQPTIQDFFFTLVYD